MNIEEWQSEELLRQAGEAFLHGDTKARAEAVERIRILIGYHLLAVAIKENDPGLQSSNAYPKGGADITERDMSGGKTQLCFLVERVVSASWFLKKVFDFPGCMMKGTTLELQICCSAKR